MHFWIDKRSTQLHYGGRRRPGPGVFYGGRLSGSGGGVGRDKSLTASPPHFSSNSSSSNNGASSSTSASSTPSASARQPRGSSAGSSTTTTTTTPVNTQLAQVAQFHNPYHYSHNTPSSFHGPQNTGQTQNQGMSQNHHQNHNQGQVHGQGQIPPPSYYSPPPSIQGHEHLNPNPFPSPSHQLHRSSGQSTFLNSTLRNGDPIQTNSSNSSSSPVPSLGQTRSRSRSRDAQNASNTTSTAIPNCDQCDPINLNQNQNQGQGQGQSQNQSQGQGQGGQRTPRSSRRRSSISISRRTPTHQIGQQNLGSDIPSREDTPSPFSLPSFSHHRHMTCSSSLASSNAEITDPKWSRRKRIGLTLCFLAFILLCNVAAKFIIEGPSLIDAARRSHHNYNHVSGATASGTGSGSSTSSILHEWPHNTGPTIGNGSTHGNNHSSSSSSSSSSPTFYFVITELIFVAFALTLFFTGVACLRKGTNDYLLRQFNQHILQQQQQQQQQLQQSEIQSQSQQNTQQQITNSSHLPSSIPNLLNNNNSSGTAIISSQINAHDYFDLDVDEEIAMGGSGGLATPNPSHRIPHRLLSVTHPDLFTLQGHGQGQGQTNALGRRYIGGHHPHHHHNHGHGHGHGNRHYHAIQIQQPPPYHIALYLPLPNQEDFETDVELKEYNSTNTNHGHGHGQPTTGAQIQKMGGSTDNTEGTETTLEPSQGQDNINDLNRRNNFSKKSSTDNVSVDDPSVIISMENGVQVQGQRLGQGQSRGQSLDGQSSSSGRSCSSNQASFEEATVTANSDNGRGDAETPPPSYEGLTFDI